VEFVQADLIAFGRVPGKIKPRGAVFPWTDAVFPVVGRNEIAARVAHEGHVQRADQVGDVAAHPVGIGGRVAGLKDAGIDRAAEMFEESRIQAVVDPRDGEIPVRRDLRFHAGLPLGGRSANQSISELQI
jgi:hypothetical protein